jgi:organic radical activating enzyme
MNLIKIGTMKMRINKILWELSKLFKGNRYIAIKPTIVCNLHCWYCSGTNTSKYYDIDYKTPPPYQEVSPEWWMKLIKRANPDVLTISGGEPGLYKGLADVINYATSRGILVQVLSNLTDLTEFKKIKKTWRVYFLHTEHPGATLKGYEEISKDFNVILRILTDNPRRTRHEKPIIRRRDIKFRMFYAPDGSLYDCCDAVDLKDNFLTTDSIEL